MHSYGQMPKFFKFLQGSLRSQKVEIIMFQEKYRLVGKVCRSLNTVFFRTGPITDFELRPYWFLDFYNEISDLEEASLLSKY